MPVVPPGMDRRGPPNSMPPQQPDRFQHRDPREMDPKSRSMANLHMDRPMDQPYGPRDPHQQSMRPAASVGALQHSGQPNHHDYYNQGPERRNDPKGHDYENHQNLDSRMQKGPNDRGYPQNTLDRQPPSSRNSNSSFRDERPHSAYFGQPPSERPDQRFERPQSMEINANKVQEWQQKYGMNHGQSSPHNQSFEHRDQNYMNTRPNMTAQQPQGGYVNQGDIPKLNANNEAYQPNFYENTVPRQNDNSPAFQQMRSPGHDLDQRSRQPPTVPSKPQLAPKPTTPKMPQVDIPKVEVDNRQTQPHFFDPRLQGADQRSPRGQQPNFGQPSIPNSTSYADSPIRPVKKPSPGREMYNHHRSPELPPPPQDIPPELPPPPAMEDLHEELPPLPPPPVQDFHNDPQYVNQSETARVLNGPQQFQPSFNPHQQFQANNPPRSVGVTQPQRHQPVKAPVSQPQQRFQTNNDYQNISYENKNQNRSFDSPHHQSPNQSMYEQYDHRAQTLPGNMTFPNNLHQNMIQQNQSLISQGKVRVVQEISERTKDGKLKSSPWDREEQEKQEKLREEETIKNRNDEISFLESKSYLSPQEQERLRKLRIEQEFQRRVDEAASRGEDDEDSDTEMTSSAQVGILKMFELMSKFYHIKMI